MNPTAFAKTATAIILSTFLLFCASCSKTDDSPNAGAARGASAPDKAADLRLPAIGSPRGNVALGEKAYSPDGKMYATEVEPKDHGRIGIYDLAAEKEPKVIGVKQHPEGDVPNELKGLAWSPDSRWLAVMYHHGSGGHISIVDVGAAKETKSVPINKWYRYMAFSPDGTKIIAGSDAIEIK